MLVLSNEEVLRCLTMPQAIEAARNASSQLSSGDVTAPLRTHLEAAEYDSAALFMPVYSVSQKKMGIKIVNIANRNPALGKPRIQALMLLFEAATGKPMAMMNAEALTAYRTGAASGLATDLLARRLRTLLDSR